MTGGSEAGLAAGGVGQADTGREQTVVLSLGSNLGDRLANLQLALDTLGAPDLVLRAVSSVYETDPVGGVAQADYLNAVVLAGSSLPATELLARCAAAENAAGRIRSQRWGPRTLDVDIVSYGAEISADPAVTLPHPRAHERAFVLVPWLELDPRAVLPGWGPVAGLPAASLSAASGPTESGPAASGPAAERAAGVRRRPELRLTLPGPARASLAEPETDARCS
jgi:2-amino-4-hydroxy-6-hydroxymethyldihydropteridine diphosphokinase